MCSLRLAFAAAVRFARRLAANAKRRIGLRHSSFGASARTRNEERTMAITAADVKALRDRTNQPMMDCKAALTEAGGDMDKAIEILRKKGRTIAGGKTTRETAEGRIGAYVDETQTMGALVEVRCESRPVVKSDAF